MICQLQNLMFACVEFWSYIIISVCLYSKSWRHVSHFHLKDQTVPVLRTCFKHVLMFYIYKSVSNLFSFYTTSFSFAKHQHCSVVVLQNIFQENGIFLSFRFHCLNTVTILTLGVELFRQWVMDITLVVTH